MSPTRYAQYAALFDAMLASRPLKHGGSLQLHGNDAGVALRTWALGRRMDVVPVVIDGSAYSGSWTVLQFTAPGELGWCISVHLDDVLTLAPPEPPVEMEIPF